MTTTITAVMDLANVPPRVLITVNSDAGTTATVNRVDAAGGLSAVRTANPATLVAGQWVGYDYEAPLNEPVTYRVKVAAQSGDSAAVTVPSAVGWLLHPGAPALSLPLTLDGAPGDVTVVSVGERTRAVNVGVHNILGSSTPVVVSDGARRAATYDLALRTNSLDAENAMEALLADAGVLLLQVVGPNSQRSLYEWVAVGDVVAAPWIDGHFPGRHTRWTLPCTVTSAPSGLLQAQWTWADVIAAYPTWNDVIAAFPTWQDLLLNTPAA